MRLKILLPAVILLGLLAGIPSSALADGIIIPEPPGCEPCPHPPCPGPIICPIPSPMSQLEIRYHRVTVTIEDQVAVTNVDQVFFNPNDWAIEGIYVFPIHDDAAVSNFTLWVDGEPIQGEVLDAEQARHTYEDIVNNLKDPALLEYVGQGALRARIFPIPPQGERHIELGYSQILPAEGGLVRYLYPLSTEKFSLTPLESVSVNVHIHSEQPIRAIYSPSHKVATSQEGEYEASVGYEDSNVLPDTDFALYYSIGESPAFHLLTFRNPDDRQDLDGFFLLLLAPGARVTQRIVPKDVLLVLDRSGSMDGEKFVQAQEALRYILQKLNQEDRFNIITFSTGVDFFAQNLRPASESDQALAWVDSLSAEGSTDINRALLEAAHFADLERPTFFIFLTDGLPTVGETDSQKILENFQDVATSNTSLFAFGVGYDVDTYLLDSLAQAHHGTSTYVLPNEQIDEIVSDFYSRVNSPVLTNLTLDFDEITTHDIFPDPLPDLFLGSQIVVVGRYRQGGQTDISLSGDVDGERQIFNYDNQIFAENSWTSSESFEALPRLWATRKIGHLLNQIRLRGPDQETIDQIVRLSIRYGIVTPYTSYLVTEPLPLGEAAQERIAANQYRQLDAESSAPSFGQVAVEKAASQEALAGADRVASPPAEAAQLVRFVGSKTFVNVDGTWMDSTYDPQKMEAIKVPFLSEDYFALGNNRPALAAAFALGQSVIAVSDDVAYEVIPAQVSTTPIDVPEPYPTTTVNQTGTSQLLSSEGQSSTAIENNGAQNCLAGLSTLATFGLANVILSRRNRRKRTSYL